MVTGREPRAEAPKERIHTKFNPKCLFDFYLIKYWQRHAAKTAAQAAMEAHPVIGSHNSYTTFDAIAYANWLAAAQPCWSNMRGTEKTGGGWQIFARIIAIACMLSVRHVRTFSSAGMSSNTFG